jgi:hypothetical protein
MKNILAILGDLGPFVILGLVVLVVVLTDGALA